MKIETKNRKKAMAGFRQISNSEQQRQQMHQIMQSGTRALNEVTLELGRQLAEFILYSEREELAGPDYQPRKEGLYKWASEPGSVYVSGQKVAVERPRLRRDDQEVRLKSYQAMGDKEAFSESRRVGRAIAGGFVSAALSRDAGQRCRSFWRFTQRSVATFGGSQHPATQGISGTTPGGFPSFCHFPGYGASGRSGVRGGAGAGYSRPKAGFGVLGRSH